MWAMMPMLRTLSSSSMRGTRAPLWVSVTATFLLPRLPAIVREGLVGLRHPVDVVLLLVCAALLVRGIEDLARELLLHAPLAALPREADQPAHGKRAGPALRHLDGHLVVGAADAARAHLEHRCDRLHGPFQHLDGALVRLLSDDLQRAVDD